jgi:hypothetical protein
MNTNLTLSPFEQLRIALGERPPGVRVSQPERNSLQDISNAVASVMNFMITDAFALNQEESMWVGYELSEILKPISALRPRMYLSAVKQELETKEFSEKMFSRDWATNQPITHEIDPETQASISDWAEMLSEIVLVSYPDLRAFIAASVVGSIYGILTELGLTDNVKTSRNSLYLPTAVRHLVGLND